MHLQQCNSVITTQSQQASSHCDCKRKKNLHQTKLQISILGEEVPQKWHSFWQQTWKRMRSSAHMPVATIGILNSGGNVCTTTVLSVCVCVWCVCLRLHACVNSAYHIAFMAQIPLTVSVFRSGDEARGMLASPPTDTLSLFCSFFFVFSVGHCTAAADVTI